MGILHMASGGSLADMGAQDYEAFARYQNKTIEDQQREQAKLLAQQTQQVLQPLGQAPAALSAFGAQQAAQAGQATRGVLASSQGTGGMQAAALGALAQSQASQATMQQAAQERTIEDQRQLEMRLQQANLYRQAQLGQLGLAREQVGTALGSERALDDLRMGLDIERQKASQAAGLQLLGAGTSAVGAFGAGYESGSKK